MISVDKVTLELIHLKNEHIKSSKNKSVGTNEEKEFADMEEYN